LVAHPAHPPLAVRSVEARTGLAEGGWLQLRWRVEGSAMLIVPRFAGVRRADGLWRSTCFELFVRRPGAERYVEINLSPSENWAAYSFSAYRQDMREHPAARPPVITPRRGRDVLILDAALRLNALPDLPLECGLSAVLEEEGGVLSYWALAHPGERPDFHDPACLAAALGPADEA
jgi:hypothetical protein